MIATPFVRLPRRKYDPRLENVPRIDLDYLEAYESDSDESVITEASFKFSDDSDDSSEVSFSPEDATKYSAEFDDDSELERRTEEDMMANEVASKTTSVTYRTKGQKLGRLKKIRNFIRRSPAYIKFQKWRKKNAEARRHAMIRRFEKLTEELPQKYRDDILEKIREDER